MRIVSNASLLGSCAILSLLASGASSARAQHARAPACVASAPRTSEGRSASTDSALRASFVAALGPCMRAMHEEMHAALSTPTAGSPDAAFAAAMIPHHQGAIDMARQLLLYGRDPELRAFALSIIAEQQAEIDALRSWAAHHAADPERPGTASTAPAPSGPRTAQPPRVEHHPR